MMGSGGVGGFVGGRSAWADVRFIACVHLAALRSHGLTIENEGKARSTPTAVDADRRCQPADLVDRRKLRDTRRSECDPSSLVRKRRSCRCKWVTKNVAVKPAPWVMGGGTYCAAACSPGVIRQTGTMQRDHWWLRRGARAPTIVALARARHTAD
jgi:hypothetical protein